MKKSAAGENFRNRNCFYTKNSAKMQKMANRKFTPPPGGGDRKCIYFGTPGRGGLQKIRGGFTPPAIGFGFPNKHLGIWMGFQQKFLVDGCV